MVTAFLLYFLTLAGLLSDDSVFMLPYMICSVLLTTAGMIRIQDPAAPPADRA